MAANHKATTDPTLNGRVTRAMAIGTVKMIVMEPLSRNERHPMNLTIERLRVTDHLPNRVGGTRAEAQNEQHTHE
jgi:hypothetical protein